MLGGDTYVIKQECIFLKNEKGFLHSYAYYIEGNPNPFDFEAEINEGLDTKYLEEFFSGDFYNILIKAQKEQRMIYIFFIVLFTLIFTMIGFSFTLIRVFTG